MRPNKIKVAVFSGAVPSTVFIENLIEGLASKGVEVHLFGKQSVAVRYSGNVKLHTISRKKLLALLTLIKWLFLLGITRPGKLLQLLKASKKYCGRRKGAFILNTLPLLLYPVDVFHYQWGKSVCVYPEWRILLPSRFVLSLRGAHINYSPLADDDLRKCYEEEFPALDGFHAVSEAIGKEACKYGASPDKIKVVYSGVRPNWFQGKPVLKTRRREEIKILSIGRSHWKKDYQTALDAMALLKSEGIRFKYEIVLGKPDASLLFQREQLALEEEVLFTGKVSHGEVKEKMLQADLLLLPSLEEGVANVVLEAMAVGLPVISTDCGGMAEVIKHGETGWLVPVFDPEKMAEQIKDFARLEDDEINRVRMNARKYVEEYHTIDKMVEGMINLYNEVLARG